jgi:hypothetical protein
MLAAYDPDSAALQWSYLTEEERAAEKEIPAAFATADVDAQWGVFLRTHFESGSDRSRLGLWENRNLTIAARIRGVAALHPGGRVLVIYGAAHKPFLEAYLSKMADLRLVGFEARDTK